MKFSKSQLINSIIIICLTSTSLSIHLRKDTDNNTPFQSTSTDNKQETNSSIKGFLYISLTIFWSGFLDKSFIITSFLAMKYNKLLVLSASFTALEFMGLLSIEFGKILPNYIQEKYINIFGGILFLSLGLYLFIFASFTKYEDDKTQEHTETNAQCANQNTTTNNNNYFIIFAECFGLVFVSEWGDKSQLALISIANNVNRFTGAISVTLATLTWTALAVVFGQFASEKISKKIIELISGMIFMIFGVYLLVQVLLLWNESDLIENSNNLTYSWAIDHK